MSVPRRVARFGHFEADLHTGELRRDGCPVPLQQQPFRLLRALLERPGELITREALRQTLWADGTFVSFERGLTSAVRKVREALGDRADHPIFIETLPGRGYRFIASVSFDVPGHPEAAPLVTRPRPWASIAAVVVLATAVGGPGGLPVTTDERHQAARSLSAYACRLKSEGQVGAALAVIRQAHALVPEAAAITAEVGLYLHAAREYEAEMPMLRLAVRQDTQSVEAWLHLGLGLARRSHFADAVAALERARALGPQNASVAFWLDWARAQAAASPSAPREAA